MRTIKKIMKSRKTVEGAGVILQRVFGHEEIHLFDPFLLLDHFGSVNSADYVKGFPWHPHRGMETVTYMLQGEVEHADSIGNKGVIKSGDIQWMTAGSGIIHQEMPRPCQGEMKGFQLWINLPRAKKMMPPHYQGISKKELVEVECEGTKIKIIAGELDGKHGPFKNLSVEVDYFDIELSGTFTYETKKKTVLMYVIEGSLNFGSTLLCDHHCALLSEKGKVVITAKRARFLLIAGNPLSEPITWGGPIVMNTPKELEKAYLELDDGTFIKNNKPDKVHEEHYKK